jgi:two-component system response regulator VicR
MSDKKILIIDDDPDIVDIMTIILESEGFDTKTVTNPLDAISSAEEFLPDAILLDLTMLPISGWEVYKLLRSNKVLSKIPIAISTAKSEDFDAVVGLHIMHADGYITKPFGKQELITKVNELLSNGK